MKEFKNKATNVSRRGLILGSAGAAILSTLPMPWVSRARAQNGPIKIGFPTPLTGLFATEARDQVRAAELAVKEWNEAGGLDGRPAELLVRDDKLDPGEGATRALELIENDEVDFIVGVLSAAVQLAVNNITRERGVIYVSISQSDKISEASDHSRFTFREAVNPTMMTGALVRHAIPRYGTRAVALVSDYAYGHENLAAFKRFGEPLGLELMADMRHPFGAADYSPFLAQIQSMRPEILYLCNFGGDLVNSVKQARDFGLMDQMKVIVPTLLYTSRVAGGAEDFEGVVGCTPYYWQLEDTVESAKRFNDMFKAEYDGRYPSDYGAMGYSGVRVLLDSVREAGTVNTDDVIEAMRARRYDNYKGPQYFRDCDHQSVQSVVVIESKVDEAHPADVFNIIDVEEPDEAHLRTCAELGHA
jgi:branched-chain amino acid transport system substrate-binding protein